MNKIKLKTRSPNKRIIRHEQWIDIRQQEGRAVVLRYPSNEQFEQERLDMSPPPDLIYRRLNFINGVPDEYDWTGPTPEMKLYGSHFLQRILPEEWPEIYEAEKLEGNRRIISALRPQPRPEELGPCPCPDCTAERATLSGKSRYDEFT